MLPFITSFVLAQTIPTLAPPNSVPPLAPPTTGVPTLEPFSTERASTRSASPVKPVSAPVLPPPEILPVTDVLQPLETLPQLEIMQPAQLRPLPGNLDRVPVFNSNSPELVRTEGVLLSTFPPERMRHPEAHLNFVFEGRFDIFSHHITRARTPAETRTMYQGIILYNPGVRPITVEVLEGATYLTRPDALFVELPAIAENPEGRIYAGPGSRAMDQILRGRKQDKWPRAIAIQPGQSQMLMNLPIPPGDTPPTSNGRSTLLRLNSSGPVYVANLAMLAPRSNGQERSPKLEEWQNLLVNSNLAGPRDLAPTALDRSGEDIIYGRVAGVAQGSKWQARITDNDRVEYLSIPERGQAFAYGLSTLHQGRLGTEQVQSAKMLVRYADTAYYAHGNYGVEYDLTLPLHNRTKQTQTVTLSIQTPIKDDRHQGALLFFTPPSDRVFFRGTVRLRYQDDRGRLKTRYFHLVQRRGQAAEPLATLKMPAGDRRLVEVDFLYPPDATPPQVLTISTQSE